MIPVSQYPLSHEEMTQADFIADSWRKNIAINRENYTPKVIEAAYRLAISSNQERSDFKNRLKNSKGI
jgi:hypothetical protein